jgi:hypothetical protein
MLWLMTSLETETARLAVASPAQARKGTWVLGAGGLKVLGVWARWSSFAGVRGGLEGGRSRVLGFRVWGLARVGDGGLEEEDDWSLV